MTSSAIGAAGRAIVCAGLLCLCASCDDVGYWGDTEGSGAGWNNGTLDLGDGVKMEFVWISAGTFTMGSPASDTMAYTGENQHNVTISRGFWMGKYEVTQEQWTKVMGSNPSYFQGAQNPVEQVSWDQCQSFIAQLNAKVAGGGFGLPTESEWEYACRAGTTIRFYTGDSEPDLARAGWYSSNSGNTTHPVGQKQPNAWGLYDMHGNVWEWCQDWYGTYPSESVTDPTGPSSGSYRLLRGGSWGGDPAACRSACRGGVGPAAADYRVGFRVVLVR